MVHIHVGDLDWQFPCQAWQTSDFLLCPRHSFVPPQRWETQLQFLPCTLMTKKDSTFKFGPYGLFKTMFVLPFLWFGGPEGSIFQYNL